MQSPCKLVFTEVLLPVLPHKHMYSVACIQPDVDWALWLKPELIVGKKCLLVHVRAVAVVYWHIPAVRFISYRLIFLESFLLP